MVMPLLKTQQVSLGKAHYMLACAQYGIAHRVVFIHQLLNSSNMVSSGLSTLYMAISSTTTFFSFSISCSGNVDRESNIYQQLYCPLGMPIQMIDA